MRISFGQSKDYPNVSDLTERLEKAERKLLSLDLEFTDLHGYVRRSMGRIEKRAAIIERDSTEGGRPQDESIPADDSPFEGLTPSQITANNRILAARRRIG